MDTNDVADRLDDLGIGILASPYIAKAVGNAASHVPRLAPVAAAANAYEHAFHATPYGEIAGLGLVAPGVVHPLAKKLTGPAEKTAFMHGMRSVHVGLGIVLASPHAALDK